MPADAVVCGIARPQKGIILTKNKIKIGLSLEWISTADHILYKYQDILTFTPYRFTTKMLKSLAHKLYILKYEFDLKKR